MWNKDEVRGKIDRMKGRIKQSAGNLRNDERMREEGQSDEAAGVIEEGFGKGRRKLGNAIKDIGKKVGQ
jgi:uncharacterized protein YjbJ (UPF0337 family)